MSTISLLARKLLSADMFKLARSLNGRINGLLNRGNTVKCPVCEGTFRRFLAAGDLGQERDQARCPRCGSVERHRLLWLFLNKETEFLGRAVKVLHFAPERCFEERFRSMKNIEYVTADLDPSLVMRQVDITDIPFDDDSFDMVICSHVLEHVADDLSAMKELKRITRPSGITIVMVPTLGSTTQDGSLSQSPAIRRARYGQADHLRLYGSDIADRLAAAGFKVDARQYANEIPNGDSERYRIVMDESRFDRIETIFLCKPE